MPLRYDLPIQNKRQKMTVKKSLPVLVNLSALAICTSVIH